MIVGGGVTVSKNVDDAVNPPASVTVNVIVAAPFCPKVGVTVTVRAAPIPPKTIFAIGTRVVLLEAPVMDKEAAAVRSSPTVNDSADVAAF